MVRLRRAVAVGALVVSSLAIVPMSNADATNVGSNTVTPATGLTRGVMPVHPAGAPAAKYRSAATAPANPNLEYFGGRVVSSPQVENVLWGSGTYQPEVTGTTGTNVNATTDAMLNSEWAAGLSEYNTTFAGGSGQSIGKGSLLGRTQITPTTATGATVYDPDIQAELTAQIAAGQLPSPTVDSTGATNTIYALYFPQEKTVCATAFGDPQPACSGTAYCAYHGSYMMVINGVNTMVLYLVEPDPNSMQDFVQGCGDGNETAFQVMEGTTSHELAETITDPAVGIANATGTSSWVGWYDNTYGEVADVCEPGDSPAAPTATNVDSADASGTPFTVSTVWSNHYGDCVPSYPDAPVAHARAISGGRVQVTWSAPDDWRARIQSYSVWDGLPGQQPSLAVGGVTGTSWTSAPLANGSTRQWSVAALNAVGWSDNSNAVSVAADSVAPKVAITGPTAQFVDGSSLRIT